jgi:hypothetical protein
VCSGKRRPFFPISLPNKDYAGNNMAGNNFKKKSKTAGSQAGERERGRADGHSINNGKRMVYGL